MPALLKAHAVTRHFSPPALRRYAASEIDAGRHAMLMLHCDACLPAPRLI